MNFLEIEKGVGNGDNIWRNIVFGVVCCLFLTSIFFYYSNFNFLSAVDDFSDKAGLELVINNFKIKPEIIPEKTGGDDIFIPKEKALPVLKEDAIQLADNFSAYSIIVKDKESGSVLYGRNEYEKRSMASITKLMSALILDSFDLDYTTNTFGCSDQVFDVGVLGSAEYSLEDLWYAGLVGSSNRAILSLADATGASREDFLKLMNNKATELGMMDTFFVEPTGLDPNNVSTASDLVLLLNEALRNERIKTSLLMKEFTVKTVDFTYPHHMWNTDWILLGWINHNFAHFNGGKTGYIPASGYNFCMEVANEDSHTLQVVVLGADSNETRFTEARDIAEWVFENYIWP